MQELEVRYLVDKYNGSDDFQFKSTINLDQLNRFSAFYTHSKFVESVLKASQSTLQELKLEQLVNSVNDDFQFDSKIDLAQLNKFTACNAKSKFVISVIRSAKTSLKYLYLESINLYDTTLAFDKDELGLIRFSSDKLEAKVVATVIQGSISSLENIKLLNTQIAPNDQDKIEHIEILLGSRNIIDNMNDGVEITDQKTKNIQTLEKKVMDYAGGNKCYDLQVKEMFFLIRQLLMTKAVVQYKFYYNKGFWLSKFPPFT